MSCVLCNPAGDIVFEDDATYVTLHDDWAVRGHAMIVAKQHVENPSALDENAWLHFARVWHRVELELLALTGAERCIAMKLGIATPHLHVHLYPVKASASRADVFAAIDMKTRVPRDEAFIAGPRQHLTPASR
ncbi:MAG TPA: HIT domain-containing protein [Thermoanaerobaculia bacterium]